MWYLLLWDRYVKVCGITYTVSHNDYNNIVAQQLSMYPCARSFLPPFLKENYYSKSGTTRPAVHANFNLSALLWDGKGCPANSGC